MLNNSLSQTNATQPNQPGGSSAFNFMQNQSLSISAKSDQGYPPTTPSAQPASKHQPDFDEFEDLSESREFIEDRIFRLKLQIIDLTITQQDLSTQQETLDSDVKILTEQKDEAQKSQEKAAEREEYEEAEKLNLKI